MLALFKGERSTVPKETLEAWAQADVKKAYDAGVAQASTLGVSDQNFINALASVNFQSGTSWNTIHTQTWAYMVAKEWEKAASEVQKSLWYKQTPVRVEDFQIALRALVGTNSKGETAANGDATPQTNATDSDTEFIARAQQAAQGKPQPGNYSSCLIYAQARSLGVTANGNTGAFNILYEGNDAKLVNNLPTASLKPGIRPLEGVSNLTTVLRPGDFVVWQRGVRGVDATYGHVAVVELVEAGRVVVSQADSPQAWKVLTTTNFVSGVYGYPLGLP